MLVETAWWRLAGNGRGGVGEYLQTWKLKLATTNTVSEVFHLNKKAKRELKVNHNDETLPFCSEP